MAAREVEIQYESGVNVAGHTGHSQTETVAIAAGAGIKGGVPADVQALVVK